MSQVLERATRLREEIGEKTLRDLATRPLSKVVRRDTWGLHEKAEYSPFEQALAQGTISREGYADLMAQQYYFYLALEERAGDLTSDPIASAVVNPTLFRIPGAIEDLAFYYGPEWREKISALPVTEEYSARIREATGGRYVAHHYTRYLADLSGGLMIADALRKKWELNGRGLAFYDFEGLGDPIEFKKGYRETLDSLPLSEDEKIDVLSEVMVAYEYNIEIAMVLGDRYLAKTSV